MAWLQVIGMGDDGVDSLTTASHDILAAAEVIFGAARHFRRLPAMPGETIPWPTPFSKSLELIRAYRNRRVVVLASGDPLWYSVGSLLAEAFAPDEIEFHPQVSAFQLAAGRLGWSLQSLRCETIHGRPVERIQPLLGGGQRLLLLAKDRTSPAAVAAYLCGQGYAASEIVALAHLGGISECRFEGIASDWKAKVPDFHVLAVTCHGDQTAMALGRSPGLPDRCFEHDGQLTKQSVRAITLSRLRPLPGERLWDLGCGCGSVAIEWMRAAPRARAVGVDRDPTRLELARRNAVLLGVPDLELIEGDIGLLLDQRDMPNAIFFGGGLDPKRLEQALNCLAPHGRLVANSVTVESERVLFDAHRRWGGDLTQLAVSHLAPLGRSHGWRPARPVTQWSLAT